MQKDFVERFSRQQEALGLTNKELSNLLGISEYTIYNLKHYKSYLTKVSYYAISGVLGLRVDTDELEELLNWNKERVGRPETNLEIAAESVNPEYVEKMEIELLSLRHIKDKIDQKDTVIQQLRVELDTKTNELSELQRGIDEKEKKAYQLGMSDGSSKVTVMLQAKIDSAVADAVEKYEKELIRIKKAEKEARTIYRELYISLTINCRIDLSKFPLPKGLTMKEVENIRKRQAEKAKYETVNTVDDSTKETLVKLNRVAGISSRKLAEMFGISHTTVCRILKVYAGVIYGESIAVIDKRLEREIEEKSREEELMREKLVEQGEDVLKEIRPTKELPKEKPKKQQILEKAKRGMSKKNIAKNVGVTEQYVAKIITEAKKSGKL